MIAKRLGYIAAGFFAIGAVVFAAEPSSQPSGQIYVGGLVVRGGVYPITGPTSVLKAIAWAGVEDPKIDYEIQIVHTVVPKKLEKITYFTSYKALKDVPGEATMLQPEDQVMLRDIKR